MALSLATVALSVGAAGAASAAAIYTTHGSALGYTNSAPDLDHLGLFWCVGFVFVLVMGGLGLGFG